MVRRAANESTATPFPLRNDGIVVTASTGSAGSAHGKKHVRFFSDSSAAATGGGPLSGGSASVTVELPAYSVFITRHRRTMRVNLGDLHDAWFEGDRQFLLSRSQAAGLIKRFFDLVFSGLLLLALAPIFALIAFCIRIESPGPVFYLQKRNGLGMQPYWMYKFRSMRNDAERDGARWTSKGDPRITRVGRLLRLTRLDELPQLINVLKGEMSLIGPRPERPEFDVDLAKKIPYYEHRYSVLPGLSGWAQVMFTYGASVDDAREKLSYDLYYVKHYSLILDIGIALKTIYVVVTGKGR